jgi:hypothetical protein
MLVVSDLHMGKAERVARRTGAMLPPYEVDETLDRLAADIALTQPERVVCLGDSFDDLTAAQSLSAVQVARLGDMVAARDWIWIEGNHDPGPTAFGGVHLAELVEGPLVLRHIATDGAAGEVSGHYHPKAQIRARGRAITRPAFIFDAARLILPAYGTYTGGLFTHSPVLSRLMAPGAQAILTGRTPCRLPMPRAAG